MADLLAPFAGDAASELAVALKEHFGSLSRALSATPRQLADIDRRLRQPFELLLAAQKVVDAAQREHLCSGPIDAQDPELLRFLRSRLCSAYGEKLLLIFCDDQKRYLLDHEIGQGASQHVSIDMRAMLRKAVTLGASHILMAHNHPSGDCSPSQDDIASTRHIANAAQLIGVSIIDHLIVTPTQAYSMRAGGQF